LRGKIQIEESEKAVMAASMRDTDSLSMSALSLILIGPDEKRRTAVARAFMGQNAKIATELSSYPPLDDLAGLLTDGHDGLIVDLDGNSEQALELIENLCGRNNLLTVIVYSSRSDPELLVRCMRAGAREFLTEPILPGSVGEALVRAAVRRDEVRGKKTASGKLLVFAGSKGGSGVTTVASNFAVSLAKHGTVLLADFDLTLGDAALTIGVRPSFTVLDAFDNLNRLDGDFLKGLVSRHDSGLAVLGAPDQIPTTEPSVTGLDRLLRVTRQEFEYVVVDAGSCSAQTCDSLFEAASTVYLVTQVGVADLRNANRFVARYFSSAEKDKLEVVLNRYDSRNLEIDDDAIARALMRPAKWRLPGDFVAAQRAQNAGIPLVSEKNALARAITEMAMAAAGQAAVPVKKKKFSLFG